MALSNDDIKQLIAILQKGLVSEDTNNENIEPSKPKKTHKKSALKNKSVKVVESYHDNQFLTMGVKDLHKEDSEIDKALRKFPPTPRTRQFKPIDVVCRSCGKRDKVSPSLIHESADRYKCNKCSSSAG